MYKGRKFTVSELLEGFADLTELMSKNQCCPSAECLFIGQQYLDDKYVSKKEQQLYSPMGFYA